MNDVILVIGGFNNGLNPVCSILVVFDLKEVFFPPLTVSVSTLVTMAGWCFLLTK